MNQFTACTLLGDAHAGGTYLLRIRVKAAVVVQFGRFQQGSPLLIPPGDYVYLGSALGRQGSMSLPRRLLRHASRSGHKPAHALRPQLQSDLQAIFPEPKLTLPTNKKLRWHIDFLLDELVTELIHVIVIANGRRLEAELGQMLLGLAETAVLVPGLGATDIPGNTHLLSIPVQDEWWHNLAVSLTKST